MLAKGPARGAASTMQSGDDMANGDMANENRANRDGTAESPFTLIVADARSIGDDEHLAMQFRRMGLRPARAGDAASLRLHFGDLTILARRAGPAELAAVDPSHPGTSILVQALPPDWQTAGACLSFTPTLDLQMTPGSVRANILREFFKAMVLLVDLFDATHLFWSPARLWSDARKFREAVAEMLVSGMPPILHLVAFRGERADGAMCVQTIGLAQFSGQELVADCPAHWSMPAVTKRLARIALDMVLNGDVPRARRYRGLEPGEWIILSPQQTETSGAQVRVEFQFDAA